MVGVTKGGARGALGWKSGSAPPEQGGREHQYRRQSGIFGAQTGQVGPRQDPEDVLAKLFNVDDARNADARGPPNPQV